MRLLFDVVSEKYRFIGVLSRLNNLNRPWKGQKIGKKSANFGFFGYIAWRPSQNVAIVCFLHAKCAGENFGILFVKIGWVCGQLWGKRPSDRNRSLWFFVSFLFCFDSFRLKLSQYVLTGLGNVNSQNFFGSGYSRGYPRTRICYNQWKIYILLENDELNVRNIEFDVLNNLPRSGPGSGTRTSIPKNCPKNSKIFKNSFFGENCSTFIFSCFSLSNPVPKIQNS